MEYSQHVRARSIGQTMKGFYTLFCGTFRPETRRIGRTIGADYRGGICPGIGA